MLREYAFLVRYDVVSWLQEPGSSDEMHCTAGKNAKTRVCPYVVLHICWVSEGLGVRVWPYTRVSTLLATSDGADSDRTNPWEGSWSLYFERRLRAIRLLWPKCW